jgi:hypothetical protein
MFFQSVENGLTAFCKLIACKNYGEFALEGVAPDNGALLGL